MALRLESRYRQKSRKSLNTPSWAEALEIAADTLKGMDPEIAAARAVTD
jgi:hypothetical protein